MNTVLGIDVGTQSVKVVFYDFAVREIVATASAPLDLHQPGGGVAEQQASWWTDALQQALQAVADDVRSSARALSVSGQQHGFVPVAEDGEVVAPVKLWCDTSTTAECEAIMHDFGGANACLAELGNRIAPGYTASKIRWLRDQMPEAYARMRFIMLPHDYMNFFLTGEHCMEAGDASGTGLLDIRKRDWSARMLRAVDPERDLQHCLPAVRVENCAIGNLCADVAGDLGLPPGIPVAIGGGDNMMGAIGTGNVASGKVTMSLGTSGTVYAYSESPVIDPQGNIAAFCASTGGWLPLLCTMNCTSGTALVRDALGSDLQQFETHLQATKIGAGGITTVPFFNGERTPDLPHAKGCITGLDAGNMTPPNLVRSVVEGVSFGLRFGVDELASLGVSAQEVTLIGGGAKSAGWRQIMADVLDISVRTLVQEEGAAFGAALQAFAVLETAETIEEIAVQHVRIDTDHSCTPDSAAHAAYEEIYEQYQRTVAQVVTMYP